MGLTRLRLFDFCPFVRLPDCPSVRLSDCPSVHLSVCPSVCPSVRLWAICAVRQLTVVQCSAVQSVSWCSSPANGSQSGQFLLAIGCSSVSQTGTWKYRGRCDAENSHIASYRIASHRIASYRIVPWQDWTRLDRTGHDWIRLEGTR